MDVVFIGAQKGDNGKLAINGGEPLNTNRTKQKKKKKEKTIEQRRDFHLV